MEDLKKNDTTSQEKAEDEALGPVVLKARDIQVFRLIHEQRYLAYAHVKSVFWEKSSVIAGACYHRLEKLIEAGYLVKETSLKRKLPVYLLTEKGLCELLQRGLAGGMPLFRMNDFYRVNMDHDLKVTTLRVFFRAHGIDVWTSERVLKDRDFRAKVPDGVLHVYGNRIAIEMENSTKGKKRYEALFASYAQSKEYERVFMILGKEIKDWVMDLDYDPSKVWFVEYKDLLRLGAEAVFVNKAASFILARIL